MRTKQYVFTHQGLHYDNKQFCSRADVMFFAKYSGFVNFCFWPDSYARVTLDDYVCCSRAIINMSLLVGLECMELRKKGLRLIFDIIMPLNQVNYGCLSSRKLSINKEKQTRSLHIGKICRKQSDVYFSWCFN